jgi:hypothetical protein
MKMLIGGSQDRFPMVSLGTFSVATDGTIFFPRLPTEPCALGSTQPLEMSTRKTPGGKDGRCVRVTTLPPSLCRKSRRSRSLNLLDPQVRRQACSGKLPFYRRNHGVGWASKNEYQDTPGGKDGRCVRVTTLNPEPERTESPSAISACRGTPLPVPLHCIKEMMMMITVILKLR